MEVSVFGYCSNAMPSSGWLRPLRIAFSLHQVD
jgi:hypothetical protein